MGYHYEQGVGTGQTHQITGTAKATGAAFVPNNGCLPIAIFGTAQIASSGDAETREKRGMRGDRRAWLVGAHGFIPSS